MRVDVITVITGLGNEALERRQTLLRGYASPGTDVRLVLTPAAPESVESLAELELAAPGILQRVTESEEDGADGIVIWGGHDPSLEAARELVSIPVVGPGMASIYLAAIVARRFSILVQLPNVIDLTERQVRNIGLMERCASIRSVGVPVLDLARLNAYEALRDASIRAIEDDGADAICYCCMAMTGHTDRLASDLAATHPDCRIINPGRAAIQLVEMIIRMGLTHSKRSYPFPPKAVRFDG